MLEQTKAIYYPNLILQKTVTRFGSRKLLSPINPYDKPLSVKKVLVKIDMLECMRDVWGYSILLARDNIYRLVSGDTDDESFRKIIASYYRTHAAFANYIDMLAMFESQDIPFIMRFVTNVRAQLDTYGAVVDGVINTYTGSKLLLENEEYRYYAVEPVCDLSRLKGVVYIT